jgi:aromatic-L-amino-acid decarboxylase
MAQEFASWVRESSVFELAAPAPLNLVCFRHLGGDSVNQHIMDNLNQNGQMYLTHTRLNDRLALRLCVGQTHTEPRHVQAAWKQIKKAAKEFTP